MIDHRSDLGKNVLGLPLVLIVEAKQNNFSKDWGQCLAELVAVQALNEYIQHPVYGIVTDAEVWQFGKLENKCFTRAPTRTTINDLAKVFGGIYKTMELATTK